MNQNKLYSILFGGLFTLILLVVFISCGSNKSAVKENAKLGEDNAEYDELFNSAKDDTKKTQDDEGDVLKLLGITPQEKAKEEVAEPPKTETPPEQNEDLKKFEKEVADKDEEIRNLNTELNSQRQKIFDLQAQLDAERTKPKTVDKSAPTSSGNKGRYDNALSNYNARNYRQAVTSFEELLVSEPNSSLADNCQYWIGECYYALGDYTKSIAAFEKVFSYNNSNKNADAQLKLGMCYWRLNDVGRAKQEFERLISLYPESKYTPIAKKYLSKM
jgi:tol-pal system protein YbgF